MKLVDVCELHSFESCICIKCRVGTEELLYISIPFKNMDHKDIHLETHPSEFS